MFGGDDVQPMTLAFLNFYVPDRKGGRLSKINPKSTDMTFYACNPLVLPKVEDWIKWYSTPFSVWTALQGISLPWM